MQEEVWAAIYCRLSEEDRDKRSEIDDSRSIQNQKSMLLDFAQRNGWQVYKVYSDDDYTGADRSRPAFNELLTDAEAGRFQVILCKSQSRFTRELELVEKYLHELFPIWGIRFIGLVDNADTFNKGNKKTRQINGLVNEWYLEDLSENIKGVLTDLRKNGIHIGSFAAYGYQKDPEQKGHLIPDDEAAETVHEIFEMFASGMGKMQIARCLNARGIPNPTEYKRLKGVRKKTPGTTRSTLWQYYVIADILINEMYIGNMVQGKYGCVSYKTHKNRPRPREEWIIKENTHEPIIERELWDKVQSIIRQKAKPGWNGNMGIFARKVKCMYCGYMMASQKSGGRYYLRCSSRHISENACVGGFISQKELSETVLTEINKMINEYLDMDEAARQLQKKDDRQRKIINSRKIMLQCKQKINDTDKALKVLYEDRIKGIIDSEEYIHLSKSFKADRAVLEEKAENLQKEIFILESEKKEEQSKREILEEFANIQELNYDIVNTLIDFIEAGRREGHYRNGKVPVVIHWKF